MDIVAFRWWIVKWVSSPDIEATQHADSIGTDQVPAPRKDTPMTLARAKGLVAAAHRAGTGPFHRDTGERVERALVGHGRTPTAMSATTAEAAPPCEQ